MLVILKSNFQRHYNFLDILFNSFCNSLISIKDKSFPTRSAVSYHCRDHVSYLAVKPLMIVISSILSSMVSLSFFFFRKPVNFFLVVLFGESSTLFFLYYQSLHGHLQCFRILQVFVIVLFWHVMKLLEFLI